MRAFCITFKYSYLLEDGDGGDILKLQLLLIGPGKKKWKTMIKKKRGKEKKKGEDAKG